MELEKINLFYIKPKSDGTSWSSFFGYKIVYFIIFVNLVQISWCQQNPTISYISKEKVVNIGDSLDLVCTVQYSRDYPVVWHKINNENSRNSLFISRGSQVVGPANKYAVNYNERTSTYTVIINKVQEVDAGLYSCQIITGASVDSKVDASVLVYVRIPPIISDNSTRSIITTVGANIDLKCYATGYPQPVIFWRREKNKLLPNDKGAHFNGNVLRVTNVTKEDRGTYYCVADNGISPGGRRNIGVEIEFPPSISVGRGRYGQALQYEADLHCHVEAFPSPSIFWMKDGVVISDSHHYRISIHATSDEFIETTLRVKRIEKKQYGNYQCKAINKLGSQIKDIELFETVNVICPPACGKGYLTLNTNIIRPAIWLIICLSSLLILL